MLRTLSAKISAASLLGSLLLGCGGQGGGTGDGTPTPDGYLGFGYTDALYVGTLTATDAAGHTTTGPIGVTLSPDGRVVDGYGVSVDPASAGSTETRYLDYRILKNPAFRSVMDAPLSPLAEDSGTTTIVTRRGKDLTLHFTGDNRLKGTVRATLDAPDFTPVQPGAGYCAGVAYYRGATGDLYASGPAKGSVAADGTFDLTDVATGLYQSGEIRGRIAADGTVADLAEIRDGNVLGPTDATVTVYGTPQNLTVVLRSTGFDHAGEIYRMVRTIG